MKYNPDIHHRRSIRLKEYDYSLEGAYFITICTQNKENLFGVVVGAGSKPALMDSAMMNPALMVLNDVGKIIEYTWNDLPNHNHGIELDEFIIMPNHVHGIVVLTDSERIGNKRAGLEPAPTGKYGLSEIVRQFKTFSAKRVNKIRNTHGVPMWQRNYYEHIIRNDNELNSIREYINNNPVNWEIDDEFESVGAQNFEPLQ
jgi:REP element-mobilizing transposase RayT